MTRLGCTWIKMMSAYIYSSTYVRRRYLLGIDECCIPLSHACPDKSSTSEYIWAVPVDSGLLDPIAFPYVKCIIFSEMSGSLSIRKGKVFMCGKISKEHRAYCGKRKNLDDDLLSS